MLRLAFSRKLWMPIGPKPHLEMEIINETDRNTSPVFIIFTQVTVKHGTAIDMMPRCRWSFKLQSFVQMKALKRTIDYALLMDDLTSYRSASCILLAFVFVYRCIIIQTRSWVRFAAFFFTSYFPVGVLEMHSLHQILCSGASEMLNKFHPWKWWGWLMVEVCIISCIKAKIENLFLT